MTPGRCGVRAEGTRAARRKADHASAVNVTCERHQGKCDWCTTYRDFVPVVAVELTNDVHIQVPRDATRADSATLAQREAITPDATNGSGPRPDNFDLSTADVRNQLEGAGVRPEVCSWTPVSVANDGDLDQALFTQFESASSDPGNSH